jgi:hypothetical protein
MPWSEFRPASVRVCTETVLETICGLAQDGKVSKAGIPSNPFRLALIAHDYEDHIYLAQPPLAVQRVLFGVLASIGRLLGYRTEYPYPYGRLVHEEERLGSEGQRASGVSGMIGSVAAGTVLTVLAALLLFLLRRLNRSTRR